MIDDVVDFMLWLSKFKEFYSEIIAMYKIRKLFYGILLSKTVGYKLKNEFYIF